MEELKDEVIIFLKEEGFPFQESGEKQIKYLQSLARNYHSDFLGDNKTLETEDKIRWISLAIDFIRKNKRIFDRPDVKADNNGNFNKGSTSQKSGNTSKTDRNAKANEDFFKDFHQNYWKFERDDGSFFELKANSKVKLANGRDIYTYNFKDRDIKEGKEQPLFTEMSPEEIFKIINTPQKLKHFKNDYLSRERAEKIFSIRHPNSYIYSEDDYIGNGYSGYIKKMDFIKHTYYYDNKSSQKILEACYVNAKEKFDKDFRQNYWKFKRDDGSFFELKASSKTESSNIYSYNFKDGAIQGGKEQLLVTEISPEKLFEIMSNQQMLNYFKNNYLGSKRAKKIFSIRQPNSFSYSEDDYIGNGYGGYIKKMESIKHTYYENKSSHKILKACYVIAKEKFDKDFRQNYCKFKRDDGSFFELKANSKTESSNIYSYNFKDEAIQGGKEQILVTEISPDEIFEIMSNQQMLDYFKNNYLGSERAKRIFSIRHPNSFSNLEDDYIGNGYGGYIKELEYMRKTCYDNRSSLTILKTCYEVVKKTRSTTYGDGSDDPRRS